MSGKTVSIKDRSNMSEIESEFLEHLANDKQRPIRCGKAKIELKEKVLFERDEICWSIMIELLCEHISNHKHYVSLYDIPLDWVEALKEACGFSYKKEKLQKEITLMRYALYPFLSNVEPSFITSYQGDLVKFLQSKLSKRRFFTNVPVDIPRNMFFELAGNALREEIFRIVWPESYVTRCYRPKTWFNALRQRRGSRYFKSTVIEHEIYDFPSNFPVLPLFMKTGTVVYKTDIIDDSERVVV